jgi:hypothetical protein
MHTRFWLAKVNGRDHSEDVLRCDDNIKMDLREIGWGCELDSSVSGWGLAADCFENVN